MKTFRAYMHDEFGVEMPHGDIPGTWFHENGIPMIVFCNCCGMTMTSPSALIDEDGCCYCSSCAGTTE